MLASTGYWPPNVEYTVDDLATVLTILKERNKR